jgi:putative nucleotidyltransferase with HDIG domain
MSDIDRKIERFISTMPSLPTTVSKVMEICNNSKTSPADLNMVIALDPVLMARVLKLINSVYYGTSQQVTSLVRAIIMLGLNTVKNLALSTAVLGNLSSGKDTAALDMDGFWRHSLSVGVAAKLLAKKRNVDQKQLEEYFTAGLLHDIGKIPLNAVLAKDYMRSVSRADAGRTSLSRIERQDFGIDHCGAGKMIAESWKLEDAVHDVIIYHHNYTEYSGPFKDVLFSIVAANRFANMSKLGFAGDCYPEKLDGIVWETLGVEKDIFFEFEDSIGVEIEKAKVFLNV